MSYIASVLLGCFGWSFWMVFFFVLIAVESICYQYSRIRKNAQQGHGKVLDTPTVNTFAGGQKRGVLVSVDELDDSQTYFLVPDDNNRMRNKHFEQGETIDVLYVKHKTHNEVHFAPLPKSPYGVLAVTIAILIASTVCIILSSHIC